MVAVLQGDHAAGATDLQSVAGTWLKSRNNFFKQAFSEGSVQRSVSLQRLEIEPTVEGID
jgi:hypothetical protein